MGILSDILEWAEKIAIAIHKRPENYDPSKLKTLDELKHGIPSGSVLLCSGTAGESRLIEEVNGTDFSHCAMIVRFHGDPTLYLWTADTVDQLEDQIHKQPDLTHPGTHLLVLKEYLAGLDNFYPSPDGSKYRFAVARLHGVDVDENDLWSVMFKYDGTPFPPTEEEFFHWLQGQADIDSGIQNAYCAQMLANTYQKMGWLDTKHPPNHYNPGSFAKTGAINGDLLGGAKLAKPEYFKL